MGILCKVVGADRVENAVIEGAFLQFLGAKPRILKQI
jgi:hypothetical protein